LTCGASGLLPTFRALHSGATSIACTLHWIDQATIDTGPIIATAQRPVDRNESLFSHIHSLYPLGVPKILDAVARLEGGEQLPAQPQDPASGGYFTFPEESELRDFLAAGWRLFDRADVLELVAAFAAKQTSR
jgi:methionyl-tRNA formyltransferase